MRIIQVILILVLLSCHSPINSQDHQETDIVKLRLKFKSPMFVGWGTIFRFEVLEVIEGDFQDRDIEISCAAGGYCGPITLEPHKIWQVSFKKQEENVKSSMIPYFGMVDRHKTAWCVETVHAIATSSKIPIHHQK